MYKAFYEGMTLTHLPLFSLFLFTVIFIAVVIRTFVLRRARDFDEAARMPLGDDDHEQ